MCPQWCLGKQIEPYMQTPTHLPLAHPKCDLRVCRGCTWTLTFNVAVRCDFIFSHFQPSACLDKLVRKRWQHPQHPFTVKMKTGGRIHFPANERLRCASSTQAKSRSFYEKTIAQVEFEEWWIEWIVCISLVNIKDHYSLGGAVRKLFCKTPYSWSLWKMDCLSNERLPPLWYWAEAFGTVYGDTNEFQSHEAKWILYLCLQFSSWALVPQHSLFFLQDHLMASLLPRLVPNICKTESRTVD